MKIKNLTPETHHEIPISAKLMNIRHYNSHMHEDFSGASVLYFREP